MLINTVKSKVIKIAALLAIFIGGVLLFSRLFVNHQQTERASDLKDPTLPVMCVDMNGNKVDRMYGFVTQLDAADMREALIPMTTSREITVSYKANRNDISSVTYEVTSPDTGEVVENAKIGGFKQDGEYMTASFSLSEPILMNREYPIEFKITTDTKEIYYYARIITRSDIVTEKYVQFVYDFYEGCTNPQGASDLNAYLETDDTITNNSYTNVNLKSSLTQVTWGNLNPQIYRKAVPTIREINAETCSITTDYLIRAIGSDNTEEIYHVHEFYRMRYYNDQMMLLDFERNAQQIVNPEGKGVISASGISLGVASRDLTYQTNSSADTVAFIQDNELWEYSEGAEKLSRVFSFHNTGDETDERDDTNNYDIRIIRVSESGDIDFTVCGYMAKGEHEGRMGISLFHYNSETSVLTERAFVEYPRSYEYLAQDLDRLSYFSDNGSYYLYLERIVYEINLDTGKVSEVLKDINPDAFVSSTDNSEIAWTEDMTTDSATKIRVMDLDTGNSREITAEDGQYIRALGFLNNDFLYGIADQGDLVTQPAGGITFAMKELKIEAFDGTVVKDYTADGFYVTDVTMKEGLAQLKRVTKDASGAYTAASDDNIMNNRQSTDAEVQVSLSSSTRQGTVVTLKLPVAISNLSPLVTDFRLIYADAKDTLAIDVPDDNYPLYYVYAYGKLQTIVTDPAEAVTLADSEVGVVINQEGQYIYERGNKEEKKDLYNDDIPEAFLSGEINAEKLQSAAGDTATVMDLSGCTLDQVLYQVSQGRAVVTRLQDGSTAVIVGYDRYNTLLYNFDTGEHYYMGIQDSTASMEAGGNIFVSYVEPQATIKAAS